jgi:hypothetical protein
MTVSEIFFAKFNIIRKHAQNFGGTETRKIRCDSGVIPPLPAQKYIT